VLRLLVFDEIIQVKRLGRTLIKAGTAGLFMGFRQDLGEREVIPGLFAMKDQPLITLPPGVYEVLWQEDGSMEQLVLTAKAIFWGAAVYPIGNGITRVPPDWLKTMQTYMTGSGLRIIAYGDALETDNRQYNPVRSSDKIPPIYKGSVVLGQVDMATGEIWPLPKEFVTSQELEP